MYSGRATSKCSSVAVLSNRSSRVVPVNVAIATELSKTSWSQRSSDGCGRISSLDLTSRRSWLARGRNIIRCSPRPTGSE